MAQIIWAESALSDLDAIADYIAIENPIAAAELVQRVLKHVDQLEAHPDSGTQLPEFQSSRYREIMEPPCRAIYRHSGEFVYVLHVIRSERMLRKSVISFRAKMQKL